MRYIELVDDAAADRLELALWVKHNDRLRALMATWPSLPDEQVPTWYVLAGRPNPPLPHEGLDYNIALGRWVWHTGAAPRTAVYRIAGGGGVARVPDSFIGKTDQVLIVDVTDPALASATNESELYGAGVPCERARLALGLEVKAATLVRSNTYDFVNIAVKGRDQLARRYADRIDQAEETEQLSRFIRG